MLKILKIFLGHFNTSLVSIERLCDFFPNALRILYNLAFIRNRVKYLHRTHVLTKEICLIFLKYYFKRHLSQNKISPQALRACTRTTNLTSTSFRINFLVIGIISLVSNTSCPRICPFRGFANIHYMTL